MVIHHLSVFISFLLPTLLSTSLLANPQDGVVTSGNAEITAPSANTVQINQTSHKAVIDWRSFNVSAHEETKFNQPSANAITLNRVNPSNGSSAIMGKITANGQVWIVNPAGVFFGPSARINVASLLATTADITNQDFMAGNYHFMQSPGWNGSVINEGNITVADNGLVALVAPGVKNSGVIQANLGTVAMAAGNEYTLDFYGDQLIQFGVSAKVMTPAVDQNGNQLKNGVENTSTGRVTANGGRVLVTASTAESVVDHSINMDGIVEAKAAAQQGGVIVLGGDHATVVQLAGTLDASGKQYAQKGGKVKVLGKRVQVANNAKIDVSGDAGGGEILVGGDYQGKGTVPTAKTTQVSALATMMADAVTNGNGGKIIAWADDSAQVYGSLSAKGGILGGNGGFIETSGKNYLDVNGIKIDLTAPKGITGTWLLDPTNIYIATNQSNATAAGMTGTDGSASTGTGGNPDTFAASGAVDDSLLTISSLTAALASANVIVTTTNTGGAGAGNITVVDPFSWSSTNTLTLTAANNILL